MSSNNSPGGVGAFVQMPIPEVLVPEVYELVNAWMRGNVDGRPAAGSAGTVRRREVGEVRQLLPYGAGDPRGIGTDRGPVSGGPDGDQASADDAVGGDEQTDVWTVEDFRRLIGVGTAPADVMGAILDELYTRSATPISTGDLVNELGMKRTELRGALSVFTRRTMRSFGHEHWPISFHRSQPGQDSSYAADRDTLSRWAQARSFAPNPVAEEKPGKDWSRVDRVLRRLPHGAWTTYGDLAAFDNSSPRAVGRRMSHPDSGSNAFRVLDRSGKVSPGFGWNDPARLGQDPVDELAKVGVELDERGAAPAGTRLRPTELAALDQQL